MTHTLTLSTEYLQTVRKALVKQLQRAKAKNNTAEIQRTKDLLNLIDLKESLSG